MAVIELNVAIIEILACYAIFFVLFIFSIISADSISTMFSLTFFLILIIPFYILLDEFRKLILLNNLQSVLIFKLILFYSNIITGFIGLFLIIQLLYLYFNT